MKANAKHCAELLRKVQVAAHTSAGGELLVGGPSLGAYALLAFSIIAFLAIVLNLSSAAGVGVIWMVVLAVGGGFLFSVAWLNIRRNSTKTLVAGDEIIITGKNKVARKLKREAVKDIRCDYSFSRNQHIVKVFLVDMQNRETFLFIGMNKNKKFLQDYCNYFISFVLQKEIA